MSKTKVLTIAVFALLLTNLGVLGFFFFSREHKPNERKMPREIIIEKLHFDENQIEKYDNVIKIHQKNIRSIDDSIRNTRNELYQLLNSETIDSHKRDSLYLKFSSFQKQIEDTHFNHFLEIKSLCKKEQLSDFKNLTEELSKIFNNRRKQKNE